MNIQSLGSPVAARLEERTLPAIEQKNAQPANTVKAADADAAGAVTPAREQPSREQVDDAVRKINEGMAATLQSLEFAIDDESKEIVVKIIDQGTREVVRQIPSVEALEIARSIDKMRGLLISQTA
ncbi:flagellar protein FlaG [Telluria aromaticivorans]|uniref:Flagellar protein FlaG n=1 Tax=Telluria aromaticivorans TaxID=2725995 RepID=A0A7Y2JY93_9BURK|nr:flagellar protein FlaG [Telluria aromaticivorans]NNG22593.1 flagellar protein FlaG [Telluria aromaticivorans]